VANRVIVFAFVIGAGALPSHAGVNIALRGLDAVRVRVAPLSPSVAALSGLTEQDIRDRVVQSLEDGPVRPIAADRDGDETAVMEVQVWVVRNSDERSCIIASALRVRQTVMIAPALEVEATTWQTDGGGPGWEPLGNCRDAVLFTLQVSTWEFEGAVRVARRSVGE